MELNLNGGIRQPLSQEQLKAPLPVNIREYQTLENIHAITGNVLSMVFLNHTIQNMVIEEVYDWLMKNNLERNTQTSQTTDSLKFTMADFLELQPIKLQIEILKYASIN